MLLASGSSPACDPALFSVDKIDTFITSQVNVLVYTYTLPIRRMVVRKEVL